MLTTKFFGTRKEVINQIAEYCLKHYPFEEKAYVKMMAFNNTTEEEVAKVINRVKFLIRKGGVK